MIFRSQGCEPFDTVMWIVLWYQQIIAPLKYNEIYCTCTLLNSYIF